MKVLTLTLKKEPFEVMITGEKNFEIRCKSKWINSRLLNKDGTKRKYDAVLFKNGYSHDKPYFIAEFKGFDIIKTLNQTFSNGFNLNFDDERWIIYLGKIIQKSK